MMVWHGDNSTEQRPDGMEQGHTTDDDDVALLIRRRDSDVDRTLLHEASHLLPLLADDVTMKLKRNRHLDFHRDELLWRENWREGEREGGGGYKGEGKEEERGEEREREESGGDK